VLIRLVRDIQGGEVPSSAARNDAWVRGYVGGRDSRAVPVVNELKFVPEIKSRASPANESAPVYEYNSVGTEWCPQSFHWVYPSPGAARIEWYRAN